MAENTDNTPTGNDGPPPVPSSDSAPPPVPAPEPEEQTPAPSPSADSAPAEPPAPESPAVASSPAMPPAPPQPGVPPQGMSPQGMPPQPGMPPQGMPPQGMPPQGMPPQGMPPQGMPPQGIPPQGGALVPPPNQGAVVPGAPAGAPAPTSAGNNDFMNTLGADFKLIFAAFKAIFVGKLPYAFQLGDRVRYLPAIVLTLGALVCGLLYANAGSHLMSSFAYFLDNSLSMITGDTIDTGIELPFSIWFQLVLTAAISAAILFFARALELLLSAKISNANVSYLKMLRLQAFTLIPFTVVMFPLWLILILPIKAFALLVFGLIMLIMPAFVLMHELMLYIGLNRSAHMTRSPLVPHTLLTGVTLSIWSAIAGVILASISF